MEVFIDTVTKVVSFGVLLAGIWWGIVKFLKRDEHFPRIGFEVSANFAGIQDGKILFEVLAQVENKGVVPIKIRDLNFEVRGLYRDDSVEDGDESIRGQTRIPHILIEGTWIPRRWNYTFIYPNVKTEYNYIASLPLEVSFVRVEGSFTYDQTGDPHTAAKLLRVPGKFE